MNQLPIIRPAERYFYVLLLLTLLSVRFFHLGESIDDPHSWRQCDTANYIWEYYQSGIDLLHPSVCWMGGHKTLILEFPLPEALVALVYKVLGPEHLYARLVFLLIYLASAFYLFRLISYLYHERLAWISAVVYLSLPLGIFYSRAIHVDFSALLCGLAAVDYLLRGLRENRPRLIGLSVAIASIGFLIKAPYLFYFALPVALFVWKEGLVKRTLRYAPLLLVPVACFYAWRLHSEAVNAAAPDWSYIPGYLKLSGASMSDWYFGTWEQRQDGYIWKVLFQERLWRDVLAKWGLLFVAGGFLLPCTAAGKGTGFARLWALGVLLYMFLFFNLNYFHDYYQIPFLPVAALLIALGIEGLGGLMRKLAWVREKKLEPAVFVGLVVLISAWNVWTAETHPLYYHLDQQLIEAGQLVQAHTGPEDLVILSRTLTDPRNPLWLYRARRNGWSVHIDRITSEVIRNLQNENAAYAGFLSPVPLDSTLSAFLAPFPSDTLVLAHDGSTLFLFDLQ